jgi:hypothetical protein
MELSVVVRGRGSRVLDKYVTVRFADLTNNQEDYETDDHEKAEKFFIDVCKDFEKNLRSASKIFVGGGYGWLDHYAIYRVDKNSHIWVDLFQDDQGSSNITFRKITPREAAEKEKEFAIELFPDDNGDFESNIYSQPDKKSNVVTSLEHGMTLRVLGSKKVKGLKYPWYEVQSPWNKSEKGWIYGAFLKQIEKISLAELEKRLIK